MKRFPFFQVMMKPDDEGAGGDNDGTLMDATRDMPDIEALERGQSQPVEAEKTAAAEREANGRFKAKEGAETAAKAEEGKEPAATEEEDEEDYIELPGEKDGEEPQRLKVSEVFAGYQKARQLEADIAAGKVGAKTPVEMSADAEKATEDLIRQMSEYSKANEIFASMQQVREPSIELLNETSEHYNPALYAQQKQQAAQVAKQIAAAKAEIERVGNEQAQLQQKLDNARFQREQTKLNEFWPELMADKAVQTEVMTKAEKAYGFKAEDFNGIVDHRHYKVLKDALAYRAAQEKTEAVVKVVRAKPKLVKGAARSSVNPKDAKRADAMDRLSKSGSIDDAADALEGFLH
jgi:hypothetical protein